MTTQEREALAKELFAKCLEVMWKKGKDYGQEDDCLSNFKEAAKLLGRTKYEVWAVYFIKGLVAIINGIKKSPYGPQVESEPLEQRIVDAINYLVILWALLMEDA